MDRTTNKYAPAFPFLELPAELRNRVYEYVIACPAALGGGRCRLTKELSPVPPQRPTLRAKRRALKSSKNSADAHHDSRCFVLMHVCRQIRAEFRPLYMQHPLRINYSRATKYVMNFYPLHPTLRENTANLVGDIQIDISNTSGIDIAPLLTRLYQLPRVKYEFAASVPHAQSYVRDMTHLFKEHSAAWKKHLGSDIGKVAFFNWAVTIATRHLEVHFKSHVPGITGYDSRVPGPLDPILSDLGLKDLHTITPHIRIWLGQEEPNIFHLST